MKIKSIHLENFGSYDTLDFYFNQTGSILISGPTGSGKSTLCDAIPWILFGKTAKGGNADEVLSWGKKVTTVGIMVMSDDTVIHRERNPNDLYINDFRGKDMSDTQKSINTFLGFDYNTYLAGAYFHEFSATAQFFIANAKNRRALIEQIADLEFAVNLQDRLTPRKKEIKETIQEWTVDISRLTGQILTINEQIKALEIRAKTFKKDKDLLELRSEISRLTLEVKEKDYFDRDIMAYLKTIKLAQKAKCNECGAPTHLSQVDKLKKELSTLEMIKKENEWKSTELVRLKEQAARLLRQENNFMQMRDKEAAKLFKYEQILANKKWELEGFQLQQSDLEVLSDVIDHFRASTIRGTTQQLEDQVNRIFSTYFDAEIKVAFSASSADKLEVEIYKDGNVCVYTQLSKGQRCLLKLCFGVAVMQAVANRHGIAFNEIFFDEALDGLDENMKKNAFSFINSLDNRTKVVVDHSTVLKELFPIQYEVALVNGRSQIEKTE